MLVMLYFMTTTLSTVGLGDFHPKSNVERLVIVPYIIFGVLLFSHMNTEILSLTFKIKNSYVNFHDINGLHLFINTLRKFNKECKLHNGFEDKLINYFEFLWDHNRNQFQLDSNDLKKFKKLPKTIQLMILKDFCYPDFLTKFKRLFQFKTYIE